MLFDAHFIRDSFILRLARRHWLAALALNCLLCGVAAGQFRFDSWTTDNGLPHNAVYAVTQTRDGYLWLATLDGLARFDGVRFTIFDKGNTRGIASNRCTALWEDADGTLWIGTEDSGLMRYRAGVFTVELSTANGLPNNQVRSVQSDYAGGLWIATSNGQVHWRDGRLIEIFPSGSAHYAAPSGTQWRLDAAGLHRTPAGQKTAQLISLPNYKPLVEAAYGGVGAYEDRRGNFWLGVPETGYYRVSGDDVRLFSEAEGIPKTRIVNTIYEDAQGAIWFGTQERGLICFKEGQEGQSKLFTVYTTADGLSSNSIVSIFQDREGTLWLGTWDRGLIRANRQFLKTYSTRDGLIKNNIYPIYQDQRGRIWLGSLGLSVLQDGRFSSFDEQDGLHHKNIQALAEDRQGRIWIGVVGGIFCLEDGKFVDYAALVGDIAVYAIHQDRAGTFWFGTSRGLFNWRGGAVEPLTALPGLPGNDVKVIHESRDGTLWIGTYSGLAKIQSGKMTAYTAADGLAGNRVRSLYEEADGTLWIGTYDDGLSRFKDGRFFSFKVEHGLYNNGVFQILEDARGNFWISCNRGIYRVSKQQLNDFAAGRISKISSVAYGKQDGMLNFECNGGRQPAGIKTRDGKLWFPTQDGAVVIDPKAVPSNPLPPSVVIESVVVDRAALPFQNADAGIEIGPGQANLEIGYTGLSYIKSEQMRFRYKLVGQDQDWVDAGTRRAAYYPYLPPGAYTFTVIAANSDGVWNETGASLRVVVVPPFYRTWWFISLAMLSLAGMFALIYRLRVAQLRKEHAVKEAFSRQLLASREIFSRQLLASQESERKRIAAELHDSLGQNLLIIKNHALLGLAERENAAAMEENFAAISEMTSQVLDETRQIAYDLRPYQIDRFGLTRALHSMLKRVAESSEIHFRCQVDDLDGVFSKEAEMNLYRIVQESINNILKHSRATEAEIGITRNGQQVLLRIADNGQGFAADDEAETAKRGFGLTGIVERARMLGGQHRFQSTPGKGAVIQISIPLPETLHE